MNNERICNCKDDVVEVLFSKLREGAVIPKKREEDAGYDIYCNSDKDIRIKPFETVMVPTGIASAFSKDYYFQIQERGSTGTIGMKYGAGVIDSGYRGEWFIPITNTSNRLIVITDKVSETTSHSKHDGVLYPKSKGICQAVLLPVPRTKIKEVPYDELLKIESERGIGALGSSDK